MKVFQLLTLKNASPKDLDYVLGKYFIDPYTSRTLLVRTQGLTQGVKSSLRDLLRLIC